jgi:DNA-binding NarL/FixJ family response regulator
MNDFSVQKIRVLIVDDQKLFAASLKNVIETRSHDIKVLNVFHDGKSALNFLNHTQPDIVLLDIRLPDINGVEIARFLHKEYPKLRFLMLTTFDDDDYIQGSMAAGAAGYLLKDIEPENLLIAIRAACEGHILLSPNTIPKLIRRVSLVKKIQEKMNIVLTKREEEILTLVIDGLNNQAIAERLCVVEQTVKNHLSCVYSKLGIHNRLSLLRIVNSSNTDN